MPWGIVVFGVTIYMGGDSAATASIPETKANRNPVICYRGCASRTVFSFFASPANNQFRSKGLLSLFPFVRRTHAYQQAAQGFCGAASHATYALQYIIELTIICIRRSVFNLCCDCVVIF
jgi:hypothetical protein